MKRAESQVAPSSGADDRELIGRIRKGDETALSALMSQYSRRVFAVAFRVLRMKPDAQEVTQDVFFAVWRSPERFDAARGPLLTWLVILSRSRALDLLRRMH
ncbi:MAG TPA: sigma factor, partial [Bryobacteraceae bacterium]